MLLKLQTPSKMEIPPSLMRINELMYVKLSGCVSQGLSPTWRLDVLQGQVSPFLFFMIGFKLEDPCDFTNCLFRGGWLSLVRTKEKKISERGQSVVRIAADKETADRRGDLVVTGQEP